MNRKRIRRAAAYFLIFILFLMSVQPVFAVTEKSATEVTMGEYGVIYYLGDTTKADDYLRVIELNNIDDVEQAIEMVNRFDEKQEQGDKAAVGCVHIILNCSWYTNRFPENKYHDVQIDLNGNSWTVTGAEQSKYKGTVGGYHHDFIVSNGNMTFDHCLITPFHVVGNAALSIYNVTFQDCFFESSASTLPGRIIWVSAASNECASAFLKNVTFRNCYSEKEGSCVYIGGSGNTSRINFVAEDCVFDGCSSKGQGGVFYLSKIGVTCQFRNCLFNACYSKDDGGVFYVNMDRNTLNFTDCLAFQCHSGGDGGFLFSDGCACVYNGAYGKDPADFDSRCHISGCYAMSDGGAFYTSAETDCGNDCTIRGFNFSSNFAGGSSHSMSALSNGTWGGAVCLRGKRNTISQCDFTDNLSGGSGGGLYVSFESSSVSNCTFEKNDSREGYEAYISGSSSIVRDCLIYSNYYPQYAVKGSDNSLNGVDDNWEYDIPGSGTEEDPYRISSGQAWNWIALRLSLNDKFFGDKYFVLDNNITGVSIPIGTPSRPFKGHFDGQNHIISLLISKYGSNAGLFGYADGAEIRNVVIKGKAAAHADLGGIAGYAGNCQIENCYNCADLTISAGLSTGNHFGGIIGSGESVALSRCYNDGYIQHGYIGIGGIAGDVSGVFTITHCRNNGIVEGWNGVGGIIGSAAESAEAVAVSALVKAVTEIFSSLGLSIESAASEQEHSLIDCCVNKNRIGTEQSLVSGGICGYAKNVKVVNCMNTVGGTLPGEGNGVGGLIGAVSGGVQVENSANYANIERTAAGGGIVGITLEEVDLPIVNCFNGGKVNKYSGWSSASTYALSGMDVNAAFTNCYYLETVEGRSDFRDGIVALGSYFSAYNCEKDLQNFMNNYISSHPEEAQGWKNWRLEGTDYGGMANVNIDEIGIVNMTGEGTELNPYIVLNSQGLSWIAEEVDAGNSLDGVYFRLKRDLTFIKTKPIGSEDHPFSGHLDGCGYIVNVDIKSDGDAGLFACLQGGTVQNLTVMGKVFGKGNTGAIAAYIKSDSAVLNCTNSAIVTSDVSETDGSQSASDPENGVFTGGIVGVAEESFVSGCENQETVSAKAGYAGGIVGKTRATPVELCMNHAAVTCTEGSSGGICGCIMGNTDIINCMNTQNGTITGKIAAGGIAGFMSDRRRKNIYNCANYATVTGEDPAFAGGIVGYDKKSPSYYDYDPSKNEMVEKFIEANKVTQLDSSTSTMTNGWYIVNGSVEIEGSLTVDGDVHLILADGSKLNVKQGVLLAEGNSLAIYVQSFSNRMGRLSTTGRSELGEDYAPSAGIGGYNIADKRFASGRLTINGGEITAVGGPYSAGIGGSDSMGCGEVTINAGTITATGGEWGTGIGGGFGGDLTKLTINGGTITARGDENGAGIGGGAGGRSGPVQINNGAYVKVYGGEASAAFGMGLYGPATVRLGSGIQANEIVDRPLSYDPSRTKEVLGDLLSVNEDGTIAVETCKKLLIQAVDASEFSIRSASNSVGKLTVVNCFTSGTVTGSQDHVVAPADAVGEYKNCFYCKDGNKISTNKYVEDPHAVSYAKSACKKGKAAEKALNEYVNTYNAEKGSDVFVLWAQGESSQTDVYVCPVIVKRTFFWDASGAASVFAEGTPLVIGCLAACVAIGFAAAVIFRKKKHNGMLQEIAASS